MVRARVTLKDIAQSTGVHISTVSRALNPNPSATLTLDVAEKVREAARKMGYKPALSAYSLRTNRTMTIGVLIPDMTNLIFPHILRGIENVLEPLGYASLIVNTDNQVRREKALFASLIERGVDGIIHAGAFETDTFPTQESVNVPLVTVNRRIQNQSIPCVVNDEAAGIALLFQHLVDKSHRKIAHISGPLKSSTGVERRAAFIDQARHHKIALTAEDLVEAKAYTEEEGYRCAKRIMTQNPGTTAMLCANDRLALGAIRALSDAGLSCPDDVSVTGFNDMPMLDMIAPGLTTIHISLGEIGKVAATLLSRMMSEEGIVPTQTMMPVRLVVRQSTAEARRSV